MKTRLFLIAACLFVFACEEHSAEAEPTEEPIESISFLTADGGEIEVDVFEDNSIVLSAIEKGVSARVKQFMDDDTTFDSLYKDLTGKNNVPQDIVEVGSKVDKAKKSAPAEAIVATDEQTIVTESESDAIPHPQKIEGAALEHKTYTANQFIDTFCDDYFEHEACRTYRTGNGKIEGWIGAVWSDCYVYRGALNHKIKRKRLGNWSTIRDNYVRAGYRSTVYRWAAGARDYLKAETWNATGDGFHIHYGWRD